MKQIATGVHFVSLLAAGIMYFIEHKYTYHCFVLTATALTLAFFIPPTGMIQPDNAKGSEYAKNSMGWSPYAQIQREADAREETAAAAKAKKDSKKKGGKKHK